MPTYTPPVSLEQFQTFIHDASTDTPTLDFFTSLLETATEFVYTFLDRDYTPEAQKTDIFWGNDKPYHATEHLVGEILSWKHVDRYGNEISGLEADLHIRENGKVVICSILSFRSGVEHRLTYTQPAGLRAPEAVCQVILELAYLLYESSKLGAGTMRPLGLSDEQVERLRSYRRVAV